MLKGLLDRLFRRKKPEKTTENDDEICDPVIAFGIYLFNKED